MAEQVEAILRYQAHGREEFLPGMVFTTSPEAFKKGNEGGMFLFLLKGKPAARIRSLPGLFLPQEWYLLKQPTRKFWALIKLNLFNTGDSNYFLNDPEHLLYSKQPFRFESIGELNYFMDEKHLNRRLFSTAEFGKVWRK